MEVGVAVGLNKNFCSDAVRQASASEDLVLIERIKDGEAAAFDGLVKKYRERLFSVVYNMISNREDAFDLVQEVFIKAYKSLSEFNNKSAFFTWLYRIALNTTITKINKDRLRKIFSLQIVTEESVHESHPEHFIDTEDAKRSIFLKELNENLNVALQKLSKKHRMVVVLCEIEGLSSIEVASILKCSEGTVRSRLHYAKERLKSYLKNYLN